MKRKPEFMVHIVPMPHHPFDYMYKVCLTYIQGDRVLTCAGKEGKGMVLFEAENLAFALRDSIKPHNLNTSA